MNERLEKKLRKILSKAGLNEDKINELVDQVKEDKAEEVSENGDNPDGASVSLDENENVTPSGDEEDVTTDPMQEAASEVVTPTPPMETPQPSESDVVPPDQAIPSVPTIDPNQLAQLMTDYQEMKKANEGLLARVESLESALRESGVISSNSVLGDENPRVTPNSNTQMSNPMDDVLREINPRKYY